MARATHGIDRGGRWYFEVTIPPDAPARGHVRVGVAQILAQTQAPVGFDEYSYGIRDTDGAVLHCAQAQQYLDRPIGPGSTIGVLLSLPTEWDRPEVLDEAGRAQVEAQYPPLKLGDYQVRQEILAQGEVQFWVNGQSPGVAFRNIYQAKYYPAVSMFGGGQARLILGPDFVSPPAELAGDFQPVSSIAAKQ